MPFYERGPIRNHDEEAELSPPPGTSTRSWSTRGASSRPTNPSGP